MWKHLVNNNMICIAFFNLLYLIWFDIFRKLVGIIWCCFIPDLIGIFVHFISFWVVHYHFLKSQDWGIFISVLQKSVLSSKDITCVTLCYLLKLTHPACIICRIVWKTKTCQVIQFYLNWIVSEIAKIHLKLWFVKPGHWSKIFK